LLINKYIKIEDVKIYFLDFLFFAPMKLKLLFVFYILSYFNINAQNVFQKIIYGAYDEYATCVKQTIDGGYIIAGATDSHSFPNDHNMYLVKTDSNGDTLWTKIYGRSNYGDALYSIQQTSDGGFIMTGGTEANACGQSDVYLIKTNNNGDTLWTKTFGGNKFDLGASVLQTTDGGFIIGGTTMSTFNLASEIFIQKTNGNGNLLWSKRFGITSGNNNSASISSTERCFQQTADGGFVIAGQAFNSSSGSGNVLLLKTDWNGNLLWAKTFGGTGNDGATSVQQTADGGFAITGETLSFGAGNEDVYLIKTDSNGNALWSKTFGGTNSDYGNSIQNTSDSGFIICGTTRSFSNGCPSLSYLIRTNSNGDTLLTRTYGQTCSGDYGGRFVNETTDGGFIITGYANGTINPNMNNCFINEDVHDIYLIKTDSNGNSGCHQENPNTIVGSASPTVTTPPITQVTASFIIQSPVNLLTHFQMPDSICTSVTGINEGEGENYFYVYPNPSIGKVMFESLELQDDNYKIEIYNAFGEKIYQQNLLSDNSEIDLSNQSKGIYFLQLKTEQGSTTRKIIISK